MKDLINCGLAHKWFVAYLLMFILPVGYLLFVIKELADELEALRGPGNFASMSLMMGIPAALVMSIAAFLLVSRSTKTLTLTTESAKEFMKEMNIERAPESESMDEAQKISSYVSEMITDLRGKLIDVDRYAQDLQRANSKLVEIAVNDGLTGLYNHKHALHMLQIELERAMRFNHPLSICMIDIDEFKRFNDTYGHQMGDKALARVAQIIEDNIRNVDIAARYGGEEFMIITPETMPHEAIELAERVLAAVADNPFKIESKPDVHLTVSVGISAYTGLVMTAEELVASADRNLYKAKRSGKNQVCIWNDDDVVVPVVCA